MRKGEVGHQCRHIVATQTTHRQQKASEPSFKLQTHLRHKWNHAWRQGAGWWNRCIEKGKGAAAAEEVYVDPRVGTNVG
jgi:hypothetical protein